MEKYERKYRNSLRMLLIHLPLQQNHRPLAVEAQHGSPAQYIPFTLIRKKKLVTLRSFAILPLPPFRGEGPNGKASLISLIAKRHRIFAWRTSSTTSGCPAAGKFLSQCCTEGNTRAISTKQHPSEGMANFV